MRESMSFPNVARSRQNDAFPFWLCVSLYDTVQYVDKIVTSGRLSFLWPK